SSMQHGTGNSASKGACQQFQNPLDSQAVQRALFTALDKWATAGTLPSAEPVSKAFGWYLGKTRTEFHWISQHSRRHIPRFQNNTVFAQLRKRFLFDGNPDNQSANVCSTVSRQPRQRPDLS